MRYIKFAIIYIVLLMICYSKSYALKIASCVCCKDNQETYRCEFVCMRSGDKTPTWHLKDNTTIKPNSNSCQRFAKQNATDWDIIAHWHIITCSFK